MFQGLTVRRIALAAMAEPNSSPDASRGAGDLIGSVAIFWTGIAGSPSCSVIVRGRGFVAVKWGNLAVVTVYVSPNISRTGYASFLDGLAACARRLGVCPSLVLGDFNAHSTAWGSRRTNGRRRVVQDWAAALDLRLMNQGSSRTCVAWRVESIVDFTLANHAVSRRVSGWEVSPEETLSDHLYILMEVVVGGAMGGRSLDARGPIRPPGMRRILLWAVTRRDEDFMATAAIAVAWLEESRADEDAEVGAIRLRRDMHAICDLFMPRSGASHRTGAVYWWFEEIARLREACIRGWTKPRWLVCTRSTAKRGGPCNEPSRRGSGGPGTSFWPASTLIPGGALTR
ncbi:uncharacterized protein LOC143304049 [Bombus vancouverensis nearcticus]|uniref:uncharacterized protein LOC143304049 n=1 Tax=Bombus vancouverensis nearcticus TaxID=2705178 RepID=UPI00402BC342